MLNEIGAKTFVMVRKRGRRRRKRESKEEKREEKREEEKWREGELAQFRALWIDNLPTCPKWHERQDRIE